MQVHASPGQTKSQVDPSFQLASTCDSVWPGLHLHYFTSNNLETLITGRLIMTMSGRLTGGLNRSSTVRITHNVEIKKQNMVDIGEKSDFTVIVENEMGRGQ